MTSQDFHEIPEGTTYLDLMRKKSEEQPDKEAFIFVDKDWNKTVLTYKDIWDKSRKYAAILRREGVKKSDIVCNTLVNSPERLITALGTVVSGATSMHGQVMLADGEDLIHNCKVAKCSTVIVDPNDPHGAWPIFKRIQYTDEQTGETRLTGLPDITKIINVNVCSHVNMDEHFKRGLDCLEEENEMFEESDVKEDDLAFVFSTSGSTGFSKQVPYSHKSCIYSAQIAVSLQGIESKNSRSYSERSLGWLGGWPGAFLIHGSTRIMTDTGNGLPEQMGDHIMRIMNELDPDCGVLLPGEIQHIMKSLHSGAKLNKRLRVFGIGGMPLTKRLQKPIGVISDSINVAYGATEIGFTCHLPLKADTEFENFCTGLPYKGIEVKIVNEKHEEVPRGTIGELAFRSVLIKSMRYLNEPERTANAFLEDGFYLTGDNGYIDDKGYVYVMGRAKFAIHCGAFIHYPGWIESRILKNSKVEAVVVIGVPDPVNHQAICACVIPCLGETLTEEELRDFCQSLFQMDTKSDMSAMPRYFPFYEAFPRNPNGKLDRKALHADACKRLKIKEESS